MLHHSTRALLEARGSRGRRDARLQANFALAPLYHRHVRAGALALLLAILFTLWGSTPQLAHAQQGPTLWTEPRTIPYLDPGTDTPFLLADSNGGIHAFSSQKVGSYEKVIVYNFWTIETGWSKAVDVLLSPLFEEAHAPVAYLDAAGYIHVVFYGGHDVMANIYHAKAHATQAADAAAWTAPVAIATAARPPITVWIEGDADDNLYLLYGGNPEGTGIYGTESLDGGESWSLPELVAATYSDRLWPYGLRMHYGDSGRLYATWNIVNRRAWGTSLYVTTYDFGTRRWHEPVEIAQGKEDGILGVQSPSLIEHNGEIFVMYDNGILDKGVIRLIRRSGDGGRTWSEQIHPFPELVGGNGPAAFVIDSSNKLRVFFGQRTRGIVANQIHGMWYSEWHDTTKSWGGVKTIVSGHLVQDIDGDAGFDPSLARSVISQGNLLMTAWRTDPGNGNNGAWYAYTELDAPYLPLVELAKPAPPRTATNTEPTELAAGADEDLAAVEAIPTTPQQRATATQAAPQVRQLSNPATPLLIGLFPVGIFIAVVLYQHKRRRY